jgi:hypothetical protein
MLKTTNGGTNWVALSSGTIWNLYSVYFTDANTGYAVGAVGTILKTTNGGGYPQGVNNFLSISNSLKLYPNPAFNDLTVETSETATQIQLSILNLEGQQLITRQLTQPKTQLDISSLPSGVYFVRLTSDKSVVTGKFIKQ